MTIKERIGFVSLTLAAAFVGGAVSGHIFAACTVERGRSSPDGDCAEVHARRPPR